MSSGARSARRGSQSVQSEKILSKNNILNYFVAFFLVYVCICDCVYDLLRLRAIKKIIFVFDLFVFDLSF
jgi:hypothetical protein